MLLRTIVGGIAATITLAGFVLSQTPKSDAEAASLLLPNLQARPASELRIEWLNGNRLLRFTTLGWNAGTGPLEVVPGLVDPATSKQQVMQRVYDGDSYTDFAAGFMDWHYEHNHFHFNDYGLYTLRSLTANVNSTRYGEKVTFCLMDTNKINTRLAGAPKRAVYSTCGTDKQGISVGWGDSYRYYLDGQWIDISGLPDGDYALDIELDPKNRLVETSDDDNTSSVSIRISGDSVALISGDVSGRPGNGNGNR